MKISVIIPCHNAEPYIGQAIGSLLEQSRPPEEIIVVDDASSDRSRAVAEAFGGVVRVLATQKGNASDTRLHGYAAATGDAVMFFDADDVLGPDALEYLAAEIEQYPDCVAACPWLRLELIDGRWAPQPASCRQRRPGEDLLLEWLRGWYHPTSTVMWSRSAYEKAGGWDARGGNNDDGYLMMRALIEGVPLRITEKGVAFYRRLPEADGALSSTRFTEKGIQERLFVLKEVARRLRENKRLNAPYRGALDDALKSTAADCRPPHRDWVQVCARLRDEFGRKPWERPLQPVFNLSGALRRSLRRGHDLDSASALLASAPPEVNFGRATAEAAARSQPIHPPQKASIQ